MLVSLEAVVCHARDALAADLDGVVVVMAFQHGEYLQLNAVASDLWRRMSEPRRVSEICEDLAAEYDGDRTTIAQDVLGFLQSMADKGIIEARA